MKEKKYMDEREKKNGMDDIDFVPPSCNQIKVVTETRSKQQAKSSWI